MLRFILRTLCCFSILLVACGEDATDPVTTVTAELSVVPETGTVLTQFEFDASASTSVTRSLEYRWDIDDDGNWDEDWSQNAMLLHQYESPGDYTVLVEVRDGNASDQASVDIEVEPIIVTADLSVDPLSGTTLTDFTFDASGSSSSNRALEFRWDWEDDETWDTNWSTETTVLKRFDAPGNRTVAVQVREGDGLDKATVDIQVDPTDLTAVLDVQPTSGTVLTDFFFDASGSRSGDRELEVRWDWNGDEVWDTDWSPEITVTRRFSEDAVNNVKMQARWGDLTDTDEVSVSVNLNHGAILGNLPIPEARLEGLTFDGENFWTCYWGDSGPRDMIRYDKETGEELARLPGHSPWTASITWDGEALWVTSSNGQNGIARLSVEDGSELDFIVWGGPATHRGGLAYADESLWMGWSGGTYGGIKHYDLEGNELGSFDLPFEDVGCGGLAWDGSDLWFTPSLDPGADENVYVLDPATMAVKRTVAVAPHTMTLEIAEGYLWLYQNFQASGSSNRLLKVVP